MLGATGLAGLLYLLSQSLLSTLSRRRNPVNLWQSRAG